MLPKEINLIPNKKTLTAQDIALRRRLSTWVPLILVGYLVVLGGVLGYWLFLTRSGAQLDSDINTEKRLIAERTNDEGLYTLLKQKALALTEIFSHRTDFSAMYNYFNEVAGSDITIKSIHIVDNGNTILEVNATNSFAVDTYVGQLLEDGPDHFRRIELSGVHLAPGGSYTISLELDIQKTSVL